MPRNCPWPALRMSQISRIWSSPRALIHPLPQASDWRDQTSSQLQMATVATRAPTTPPTNSTPRLAISTMKTTNLDRTSPRYPISRNPYRHPAPAPKCPTACPSLHTTSAKSNRRKQPRTVLSSRWEWSEMLRSEKPV